MESPRTSRSRSSTRCSGAWSGPGENHSRIVRAGFRCWAAVGAESLHQLDASLLSRSSDPLHDRHVGLAAWTICSSMPTIEHGSATTLRPDGSRTLDEVVPHLGGQVNTRLPGLAHHQQREIM